jgi:glycosyltransferase involved in cell wall biosynthesis
MAKHWNSKIAMRIEVVHNIPSPYRLHLFRALQDGLRNRGGSLQVHFMALGHRDRPRQWEVEDKELGFPHTFWRDLGPSIGGRKVHWNPGLVAHIRKNIPPLLMVGGPWDTFTSVLLSSVAARTGSIAWFEGNTASLGQTGFPIGAFKRWILKKYKLHAVPGEDGRRFAKQLLGTTPAPPPTVILPNIVDERLFTGCATLRERGRQVFERWGIEVTKKVAVWPARFVPAKGILDFIRVIEEVKPDGWTVVLIGNGPLHRAIEKRLASSAVPHLFVLRPYVEYALMPAVYAGADLFVLPSLHDPNPLSVNEAMHSGLPLLLSTRAGNYFEALHEHENGWAYNPMVVADAICATRYAFNADRDELRKRGRKSAEVAARYCGTAQAIDRLIRAFEMIECGRLQTQLL